MGGSKKSPGKSNGGSNGSSESSMTKRKYKVVTTPNAGRTLVAGEDIKVQDKVLEDVAPVVAPILFTGQENFKLGFFCIQCFRKVNGSKKCAKCKLPVCDKPCSRAQPHAQDCPVLRDMFDDEEFKPETLEEQLEHLILASSCLSALRLLRMRREGASVATLVNSRPKGSVLPSWESDVVEMLSGCNIDGKTNPIKEEEIVEALGIWATNGVKVQRSSMHVPVVVLFPEFCLCNHSCLPKMMYIPYFGPKGYMVETRAQRDIKAGEEMTIRYTDALTANWERRKSCREKWNFTCQCSRCQDPTEFGTMTSGLICVKCPNGTMLVDTKDHMWTCNYCKSTMCHKEVYANILDPLKSSMDACLSSGLSGMGGPMPNGFGASLMEDILMEQWLWTADKMLHPNHAWILEMEYRLLFCYAKKLKPMKRKRRPWQERMVQLALHLLEVLGKIDDGPTRWSGMIMQELVTPLMDISKKDRESRILSTDKFKSRVTLSMKFANKAIEYLKFDPKNVNLDLSDVSFC